jgi:hypothetical protein
LIGELTFDPERSFDTYGVGKFTKIAAVPKLGSKENRKEVFRDLDRREQAERDARDQEAATKTQIIHDISRTTSLPPISHMATSTWLCTFKSNHKASS